MPQDYGLSAPPTAAKPWPRAWKETCGCRFVALKGQCRIRCADWGLLLPVAAFAVEPAA